jgi:hypothetical protein
MSTKIRGSAPQKTHVINHIHLRKNIGCLLINAGTLSSTVYTLKKMEKAAQWGAS